METSADSEAPQFEELCASEFVPQEAVERAFKAAERGDYGQWAAWLYHKVNFEPASCPSCGAVGWWRWHMFGALRHPECGSAWFVNSGAYCGRQIASGFRWAATGPGDKGDGILVRLFVSVLFLLISLAVRLPMGLLSVPVQAAMRWTNQRWPAIGRPGGGLLTLLGMVCVAILAGGIGSLLLRTYASNKVASSPAGPMSATETAFAPRSAETREDTVPPEEAGTSPSSSHRQNDPQPDLGVPAGLLPSPSPAPTPVRSAMDPGAIVRPIDVKASRDLVTKTKPYRPEHAVDGDPGTGWGVGNAKPGEDWIELVFGDRLVAGALWLDTGYMQKALSVDPFIANQHLKRVRVTTDSGSTSHDVREDQRRIVAPFRATRRIRLTIEEVFAGTRWQDLILSEIQVRSSWGDRTPGSATGQCLDYAQRCGQLGFTSCWEFENYGAAARAGCAGGEHIGDTVGLRFRSCCP